MDAQNKPNAPPPLVTTASEPKYRLMSTLQTQIALAQVQKLCFLLDGSLKTGLHLVAGPGAGKSRLLGRLLAWFAVRRRKPLVIIDPVGGVIDNLLDVIARLPLAWRRQIWPRLRYVDAGATDYIVPTPLYYRLSEQETLFAIANRLATIFEKQDPALADAPILGMNALKQHAVYAGQIAAALGKQVDFVLDLTRNPKVYKEELRQALAMHAELQPAIDYFRELMEPVSNSLREKRTASFLTKMLPFLADPMHLAHYAHPTAGIDLEAITGQGLAVLLDYRTVNDPELRKFRMLWDMQQLTSFIKHRGMVGRGQEILLIIDEITQMLTHRTTTGHSLLAEDLEELVAVLGRNMGVNVVIAHQNLAQVEPRIQNVLMQMGTQVIGRLGNPEDALTVAKQLLRYDPYRVKKYENVWMNTEVFDAHAPHLTGHAPTVIDKRIIEFSADEQYILLADQIKQLDRFAFLIRAATAEGKPSDRLRPIHIESLDPGLYPDQATIAVCRAGLRQACGVPMATVLAELEARRQGKQDKSQVKSARGRAILPPDAPSLSTATPVQSGAAVAPAPATRPASDDDFWQEIPPHEHPLNPA